MKLINGNQIAEKILARLQNTIQINKYDPQLDIIQVGTDYASTIYVEKKKNWAEKIGISVRVHKYDDISENKLMELVKSLNNLKKIDGILIQLPIKGDIDTKKILSTVAPEKDVDGLNPLNLGRLWQRINIGFISATALAILECLKYISIFEDQKYSVDELHNNEVNKKLSQYLQGKNILIINHSILVGKPLAGILTNYNSTVTIAHKYTKNLSTFSKQADIIISATGIPGFLKGEMIPEKAILIDVGIEETAKGIGGDIDYKGIEDKIAWITPVPGGVGAITVAKLLENVILSHERRVTK